jgi:hypothetical protein
MQEKTRSFRNPMQILQILVQLPDLRPWGSVHQHADMPPVWDKPEKLIKNFLITTICFPKIILTGQLIPDNLTQVFYN